MNSDGLLWSFMNPWVCERAVWLSRLVKCFHVVLSHWSKYWVVWLMWLILIPAAAHSDVFRLCLDPVMFIYWPLWCLIFPQANSEVWSRSVTDESDVFCASDLKPFTTIPKKQFTAKSCTNLHANWWLWKNHINSDKNEMNTHLFRYF